MRNGSLSREYKNSGVVLVTFEKYFYIWDEFYPFGDRLVLP